MKYFHTFENYVLAQQQLERVVEVVIRALGVIELESSQKIQLNFCAKAVKQVRAVNALWQAECFDECYIIQRCILDRLFHLKDLNDKKCYKHFEDFSFYKTYQTYNNIRNDPNFSKFKELLKPTKEENKRFQELSKEKLQYQRPKANKVAKSLDLEFIYHQGFDWASTSVHPLFSDGEQDVKLILEPNVNAKESQSQDVLHNSLLYSQMILNEALVALGFSWRSTVPTFIEALTAFLHGHEIDLTGFTDDVVKQYEKGIQMYKLK